MNATVDAQRTRDTLEIVAGIIEADGGRSTGDTIAFGALTLRYFDRPGVEDSVFIHSLGGEHLIITAVTVDGWQPRLDGAWQVPPADAAATVTVMRSIPKWSADALPAADEARVLH